jgi:hypothetical protein
MMESDPRLSGHTQGIQGSAPNPATLPGSSTSASALRNTALILLAAILAPGLQTFLVLATNSAPAVSRMAEVFEAFYIRRYDVDAAIIAGLLFGPLSLLPWWRRLILVPLAGLATASLLLAFLKSEESLRMGLLWVSVFSGGFTVLAFRALGSTLSSGWACLASSFFYMIKGLGLWQLKVAESRADWPDGCLTLCLFCLIGIGLLSLLQPKPDLDRAPGSRMASRPVASAAAVALCSALILALSELSSAGVSYEISLPGGVLGALLAPVNRGYAIIAARLAAGLSGCVILRWSSRPSESFVRVLMASACLLAIAAILLSGFLTTPLLKQSAIGLIAPTVRSFVGMLVFCAALSIAGHRWAALFYALFLSTGGLFYRFLAVPITTLNQHDAGRIVIGLLILGVGWILWFLRRPGYVYDASRGGHQ